MNPVRAITQPKLLTVAAVIELSTGAALLVTPGLVSRVLLAIADTEATNLIARCYGRTWRVLAQG